MKRGIAVIVLSVFALLSCSHEQKEVHLSNKQKLEMLVGNSTPHLISNVFMKLLHENNIRSIYDIEKNLKDSQIDTTTYIEYDSEGRIVRRTTSECTTIGCLPFPVRQEFEYEGEKVKRMGVYTFKNKYKYMQDYFDEKDMSKLTLFHFENYTYKDDTIYVESSLCKWKYIKDTAGKLTFSSSAAAKSLNEVNLNDGISYFYYDSSAVSKVKGDSLNDMEYENYKVINHSTVILTFKNFPLGENTMVEFKLGKNGLLDAIDSYKNEKAVKKEWFVYLEE
ncbi:MAG: hypothetical protein V1720_00450 [bacterium]